MKGGWSKVVHLAAFLAVAAPIRNSQQQQQQQEQLQQQQQQQQRPLGVASHFPRLPELPPSAGGEDPGRGGGGGGGDFGGFLAVSSWPLGRPSPLERKIMAADVVARPLGADLYDLLPPEEEGDKEDKVEEEDVEDFGSEVTEGEGEEGTRFEGDIAGVFLASLDNFKHNQLDRDSILRNAVSNTFLLWPNGEIPYSVSSAFSRLERRTLRRAAEEFERRTGGCVRWRPRRSRGAEDRDYVHFLKHDGCYSKVGRHRGGQVLSLGRGCVRFGTVLHEMLHAAGFWHEQSRPDRDKHVQVKWNNIRAGAEDNFAKYSRGEVSTLGLPYEAGSVMHYDTRAFSRNGLPTIISTRGLRTLGQREGMTELDAKKLRRLYGCEEEDENGIIESHEKVVDPSCRDRLGQKFCHNWLENDACNKYRDFMISSCPRTCGLCPLVEVPFVKNSNGNNKNPGLCMDRDERCEDWTRHDMRRCVTELEFMASSCARTCGFCDDSTVTTREKNGGHRIYAKNPLAFLIVFAFSILFVSVS